jgi:hypothetical protein
MSHSKSLAHCFALRTFQTRMLHWLFVVFSSVVLLACGGGGGSGSEPAKPTAGNTSFDTSAKLQASSLRNLTIVSLEPTNTQWLVRAVIGDRYFDNQNGSGVALNSVPRFAKICAEGPSPCQFDTYSLGRLVDGTVVESITAFGKWWNFDVAGNEFAESNKDLKSVPRFANGPCLPAIQANIPCRFESHGFGRLNNNSPVWVQSITAYGRGYNFDENGTPYGGNGFDLKSIGRFAQGPCADVPAAAPCQFTARTFHEVPAGAIDGASWLEWILRDGRIWVFDANGQPRDPNSYQRIAANAGTPADQVNLLKNIFDKSEPPPPPPQPVALNLILPGQQMATFACDVTESENKEFRDPKPIRYRQVLTFTDSAEYYPVPIDATTVKGSYSFNKTDGSIEFFSGVWVIGSSGTGRLDRSDSLSLYSRFNYVDSDGIVRGYKIKSGSCVRIATKSGVDTGPVKTIIKLADEAKACLNYPDANQCEASKLFVSLLGSEGDPSSVAYWAGVPLSTADKRRAFIETYTGATTALVTRFYQACLLREPDPQGLLNWRAYLEGNGAAATARIFEVSDEAISKGLPCKVEVQ